MSILYISEQCLKQNLIFRLISRESSLQPPLRLLSSHSAFVTHVGAHRQNGKETPEEKREEKGK